MKEKYYIGLAISPHDPALAIVNHKGEVVFAEAAERYLQNKRAWFALPDDFIRAGTLIQKYCNSDCDLVLVASWQKKFFKKFRRIAFSLLWRRKMLAQVGEVNYRFIQCLAAYINLHPGVGLIHHYKLLNPSANIEERAYDHHLCHGAAAAYNSPFNEGVCAVIDGLGERGSISYFCYSNGQLQPVKAKVSIASLGDFYSFLCTLCGFDNYKGEEWKVMGLASYGKFNQKYYDLFDQLMKVDNLRMVYSKQRKNILGQLLELRRTIEPALEFADLAFTGQAIFSEWTNQLLNNIHRLYPSDNLILGGGCALNSAYVGRITENTPFKHSYVYCAPADDGNAVGAALLAYYEDNPHCQRQRVEASSPYIGTPITENELERLKQYSDSSCYSYAGRRDDLYHDVAQLLADGKIIGWMQNRAEFGPRALGARSILADPRSTDMKEKINTTVKFRENFRPFAPAILHEYGSMYFKHYQDTPYMERALEFRTEVKNKVPAVVHVDGTGRLQSVTKQRNLAFYHLLSSFYQLTGTPILLNTSFNLMGKPIIHSVQDAVSVFNTSGLDVLVIDDQVFKKGSSPQTIS